MLISIPVVIMLSKKATPAGGLFSAWFLNGGLEEEARGGLHLAIRLCIRDLAKP